jgi:hypothetical protein
MVYFSSLAEPEGSFLCSKDSVIRLHSDSQEQNPQLYFGNRGLTTTLFARLLLKYEGTRAETRFCLSAKRTSPFKSAGTSVQSTAGSRGVRISGSNAGYTMFRGSVKGTGYTLHSPFSPLLPLSCVTMCHYVSTGLYQQMLYWIAEPSTIQAPIEGTQS